MRALHASLRGISRLNDWLGRLVSYFILLIFLLLIAEVGFRYFAGKPQIWTNELSQMLFGAYAVLSGGYLLVHRAHVNVDIFYGRFPRRVQACIDILTSILFFVFVGALLYFGSSFAYESIEFWERSQSAWNPPLWPVKLTVPIGAGLLLLQGLVKLVQDICIALGVSPPEGKSWDELLEDRP